MKQVHGDRMPVPSPSATVNCWKYFVLSLFRIFSCDISDAVERVPTTLEWCYPVLGVGGNGTPYHRT